MKRLIAIALASFAFANVAFAQNTVDQDAGQPTTRQSVDQRQAFDYLTKFSPL